MMYNADLAMQKEVSLLLSCTDTWNVMSENGNGSRSIEFESWRVSSTDSNTKAVVEEEEEDEAMKGIGIDQIRSFQEFISSSKCKTILALVGAGLSSKSGLPTFRGSGGLWYNYNSIDLATPDAFINDPGLVWQFYTYRRSMALEAEPNQGHMTLSQLSYKLPELKRKFMTITQNVDGLSSKSGHCKDNLLEIHGSLFQLRCTNFFCSYVEQNNFDNPPSPSPELSKAAQAGIDAIKSHHKDKVPVDFQPEKFIDESNLPHCPSCKTGLLRPGVVWFGESLPLHLLDKADEFIVRNQVDLILVIGTSQTVWPAASYIDIVRNQNGKVAIFNTEIDEDEDNKGDWLFKGDASITLPLLFKPLLNDEQSII